MSRASKVGSMALAAQRLGFDELAHRLIDSAIARVPIGGVLEELTAALRTFSQSNPQFHKAVELQSLIDEIRSQE